ncbi:MAG: FliM/FliN family flagellar motor switch protein [Devosia sp.]
MSDAASVSDRLLDAAGIQIDRLPMLPVIFDRVANQCAESLRSIAASPCYFSVLDVESGRIGDMLEPYEANAITAIIEVPEWDSNLVLGFDRDFIFTIVEVMFGADGNEPPEEDGRTFSNIETKICAKIAEIVTTVMAQAFGLVTKATFRVERLETRMHFAVIGRRNAQAMAAKFLVQAINRGGEMFLIMPHSALTPIRRALSTMASSEPGQRDPNWMKQMRAGVTRAEVTLQAILEEKPMSLHDIAAFKPGQVIALSATPKTPVKLEANDQPLFWCQLGQSDGMYKLRIDNVFDPEQEFLGDILNH